jgi:hypothetical protein
VNPLNIAFATSQTPNCGNPVSFALVISYSLVSLRSLTYSAVAVQILSPLAINHGVHAQDLTASVNS